MAKGRPASTKADYTPAAAKLILERLVRRGKVNKTDLAEAQTAIDAERQQLMARLEALGGMPATIALAGAALGAAAFAAAPAIARATRKIAPAVRKVAAKVTPEREASRKLQGRYLGLMRQIPKTVVARQFGKEAIGSKGKETVVSEMEAYLKTSRTGAAAPRKGRKRR